MDEKEFKARAERLAEIGKVLEKLPAEIRSDAYESLRGYVTGEAATPHQKKPAPGKPSPDDGDADDADFFGRFDHDKPADNCKLIAASFYREYGGGAFSLEDVREKATNVGLTIPDRIDATFSQTAEKGKKLFTPAGRGKFRPTVHGEAYLKTTYSVKKGNKKREEKAE